MKWQWSQKRGSLLNIVLIGIIGLAGLFLYQPQTVSAHPLGNFSVNRYSRLEPGPETLFLLYVVDMAEVPAFQEQSLIDSDLNGRISDAERQAYISGQLTTLKSNLTLLVNGKTADLQPLSQRKRPHSGFCRPPGSDRVSAEDRQAGIGTALQPGDTERS
jgi:hypothetical protein